MLYSLYREGCDLIIALRSHLSSDPRCNKRHIELSDAISKLINDIDSSCLAWDFAEQHKLAENERMLQTTDTSENILNQPYDKKLSANPFRNVDTFVVSHGTTPRAAVLSNQQQQEDDVSVIRNRLITSVTKVAEDANCLRQLEGAPPF